MPADFQCPVLAAKCNSEARGDGGRGRDGAREALGLKGKEAKADWREGKKGPGGSFGSARGHQPHQDPERRGGRHRSRREGLTRAGSRRAEASSGQGPAWPQALPGAQCLGHIQPTPAGAWPEEQRGHRQTLPLMIPGAGPRPLWASLPVGQVPLPAPVAGAPHSPENSPEATGHY